MGKKFLWGCIQRVTDNILRSKWKPVTCGPKLGPSVFNIFPQIGGTVGGLLIWGFPQLKGLIREVERDFLSGPVMTVGGNVLHWKKAGLDWTEGMHSEGGGVILRVNN